MNRVFKFFILFGISYLSSAHGKELDLKLFELAKQVYQEPIRDGISFDRFSTVLETTPTSWQRILRSLSELLSVNLNLTEKGRSVWIGIGEDRLRSLINGNEFPDLEEKVFIVRGLLRLTQYDEKVREIVHSPIFVQAQEGLSMSSRDLLSFESLLRGRRNLFLPASPLQQMDSTCIRSTALPYLFTERQPIRNEDWTLEFFQKRFDEQEKLLTTFFGALKLDVDQFLTVSKYALTVGTLRKVYKRRGLKMVASYENRALMMTVEEEANLRIEIDRRLAAEKETKTEGFRVYDGSANKIKSVLNPRGVLVIEGRGDVKFDEEFRSQQELLKLLRRRFTVQELAAQIPSFEQGFRGLMWIERDDNLKLRRLLNPHEISALKAFSSTACLIEMIGLSKPRE